MSWTTNAPAGARITTPADLKPGDRLWVPLNYTVLHIVEHGPKHRFPGYFMVDFAVAGERPPHSRTWRLLPPGFQVAVLNRT